MCSKRERLFEEEVRIEKGRGRRQHWGRRKFSKAFPKWRKRWDRTKVRNLGIRGVEIGTIRSGPKSEEHKKVPEGKKKIFRTLLTLCHGRSQKGEKTSLCGCK